jgi:asparagine N-glycosylation enzyme membrane subunit Stt3
MWRAIAVGFFHGAAINTPIVFYALYMQRYHHGSPWEIGIGFLPCNAAIIGASLGGARLAAWIRYRMMMAAGMAAVMGGVWWLTTISVDGRYATTILPGWILFGLGVGAAQIGIVGAATDDAPKSARGVVGGLVNTTGQVGTAVGLAVLTVVSSQFTSAIDGYRAAFATGGTLALAGVILSVLPIVRRGEAASMAACREEERAGA